MFRAIFNLWILSWIIYTFSYFVFFDTAEDVVEKATFEDLIPYFVMEPRDTDGLKAIVAKAENRGFLVDEGIVDSLEDNPNVTNVSVEKTGVKMGGYEVVRLQYDLNTGTSVKINFVAANKAFIRNPPFAFVYTPWSAECSNQSNKKEIIFNDDMESVKMLIMSAYANEDNANGLVQAVRMVCPI